MAEQDCDTTKFYPPSDVFGGYKPAPACLPAPPRVPDTLKKATGRVPKAKPLLRPKAITTANRKVTAECTNESKGVSVNLGAGLFTDIVPFSKAPSIEAEVLDYITVNDLVPWISNQILDPTFSASKLADATGMRASEAATMLEAVRISQNELTATARSVAQSQLVCYWENEVQVAECADPEMAKPEDNTDAVFKVVIPAGYIKSDMSLADANSQALQLAVSMLNCFYSSDPISVDCTTRPDRPFPITEPVPTDTSQIYPGVPLRVGTFNVRVGTFTSTVSKQDANEQATNFAYSKLVCLYLNDVVYLQCEDPTARKAGLDPNKTIASEADPLTQTSGQYVTIPRGYITSDQNTEEATTTANDLAVSLLECCFINKAVHVECPPFDLLDVAGKPVLDKHGVPIKIPASQTTSPTWSFDVPAGTYIDCSSQEQADAMALATVEGVLSCYYCNEIVLPSCVPEWVIMAVTDGVMKPDGTILKLTLPIDPTALINPYTGLPEDISGWSLDATTGMGADVFCSPEYIQSQQIAEDAARVKVSALVDTRGECQFTNDLMIAACTALDPYNTSNPSLDHTGHTPGGEFYRFAAMFPPDTCLDKSMTSPRPMTYVEIPAGMIVVTALDTPGTLPDSDPAFDRDYNSSLAKAYANSMAYQMAMSLLTCIFANPPADGVCEYGYESGPICADKWVFGAGKGLLGLAPESNTARHPFVVSGGMFTSTVSLEEVYADTRLFVLSNIYCTYCNDAQQSLCPPNKQQMSSAVVDKCLLRGETLEEANRKAKGLSESMLVCIDPHSFDPPIPGPPGADGAPGAPGMNGQDGRPGSDGKCTGGQCQGQCFGVYS